MWNIKHHPTSSRFKLFIFSTHHDVIVRNKVILRGKYHSFHFSNNSSPSKSNTQVTSTTPSSHTPTSKTPSTAKASIPMTSHDIRLWKHYLAPSLFALVAIGGSFLMAASSYEREQTFLWRQSQHRREQLRKKLRNSVDDDTFKAAEWRRQHDDQYRAITRTRQQQRQEETAAISASLSRQQQQQQQSDKLEKQQQRREDPGRLGGISTAIGMLESWAKYQVYQCQQLYLEKFSSPSQRTLSGLIGLNVLVFVGWRLLPLKCQPFMTRWFTNHPVWCVGPRNLTLIASNFSHQHLLPLTVNMIALWYFGTALHDILGRQQFLAFYFSSAVTSATISRILGLLTRRYRPILLLPSSTSLGASGTVYSCLAAVTALHPHYTIDLIPRLPIEYSTILPGLLTVDITGILFQWRLFDHYAHLGGAGFGLWYMTYGQEKMWIPLVRKIRDIRDRNERNGRNGSGPPTSTIDIQAPRLPWIRRVNKE